MKVECPHCGKPVVINGLGRKPLNIPLKNVCEALRTYRNIGTAAQQLSCSQGYIFNALKSKGLRVRDVIRK